MSIHKKSFGDIYASMVADSRVRLPELSDFEEGSVARSLFESFAYELATLYEQLDLVYQAGFIDTAEGAHLERVVAVLGLKRNEPDFAAGAVTFQRDAGSTDEVLIPIGTLVTTEDDPQRSPAKKAYVTIEEGRLAVGAVAADVRVRAEERGKAQATDPDTIVVMPRPIAGVKSVTNKRPVRFLGRDRETDEELRDRAKHTLLASGRASSTAIEHALLSLPDVREVRIHEGFSTAVVAPQPGGAPAPPPLDATARPGAIEVYVDGLNDRNQRLLRQRVDEVRAAGIYVVLKAAAPINVEAVARIEPASQIAAAEYPLLEENVRNAINEYLDRLKMGEPLLFSQLTSDILAVKGVADLLDIRLLTYREVDVLADGKVALTRAGDLDRSLQIETPTSVRTLIGKEYIITEAQTFEAQAPRLEAPIQALQPGRVGELTTSGVLWEPLVVSDVELSVSNERPILLPRQAFTAQDKRIASAIFERFVPAFVRVAANVKDLPLIIQIKLTDPGLDREEKRRKIEAATRDVFADLAAGSPIPRVDLEKKVRVYHRKEFSIRLIALPFQSQERPEDAAIAVSFVEKPVPANIFVYSDRVELGGLMRLTLPATATDAERRQAGSEVRRAIEAYLDDLAPEQDIDLAQINAIAANHPEVAQVAFTPKQCQLYRASAAGLAAIADRNNGKTVKVGSYEKAFLAAEPAPDSSRPGFVIQA